MSLLPPSSITFSGAKKSPPPKPPGQKQLVKGAIYQQDYFGQLSLKESGRLDYTPYKTPYGDNGNTRPIGTVSNKGWYQLEDGQVGHIFSSDSVLLSLFHMSSGPPLANALKTAEWNYREVSDLRPRLRREIWNKLTDSEGKAITGKGIKVAIMERHFGDHAKDVALDFKEYAPGATTQDFPVPAPEIPLYAIYNDEENLQAQEILAQLEGSPRQLDRWVESFMSIPLRNFTAQVTAALKQAETDPTLRLVNLSDGPGNVLCLYELAPLLEQKQSSGEYVFPNLRRYIFGNKMPASRFELESAVATYVNKICQNSPQVRNAKKEWEIVTHQAVSGNRRRKPVFIVAAAGNRHNAHITRLHRKTPDWELNALAYSPYVISVAASNTNQTPDNMRDDRVGAFSSRGDGKRHNPTVALPGEATSTASPHCAAVIAMLLQKKPDLRYSQVLDILKSASVKGERGYSKADYGFGFLDPVKAFQHQLLQ